MTREPKYFYYISKTKVERLFDQLPRRRILGHLDSLSLRIWGIEVRTELRNPQQSLLRKTMAVVATLRREELLENLTPDAARAEYVFDDNVWCSGLVGFFSAAFGGRVIAYILWRRLASDVFLLAGSPANILGHRELSADADVMIPGSDSMIPLMVTFLQSCLGPIDETFVADADWTPHGFPEAERMRCTVSRPSTCLPIYHKGRHGEGLLNLWSTTFAGLPRMNIETVFRPYTSFVLSAPEKTIVGQEVVPSRIVVGSPLYTAIKAGAGASR